MKIRYKGDFPATVRKGDFSINFNPGEEKEVPDDIGNDLINYPLYEKIENKSKLFVAYL